MKEKISHLRDNLLQRDFFCAALALIPLIRWLPNGLSYHNYDLARFVYLQYLAAFCLISLAIKFLRAKPIKVNVLATCLAGLALLQLLSFFYVINLGQGLRALLLTLSLGSLGLFIANRELKLSQFKFWFAVPAFVAVAGAFSAFYSSDPIFSGGDLLGSLIGSRNGTSIFLAMLLPLFLSRGGRWQSLFFYALSLGSVFVMIVNRTRSTWLMLACYVLLFLIFWLRTKKNFFRDRFMALSLMIALSIGVLYIAPPQLRWNKENPYYSSLVSIADPEQSSSRNHVWKIAAQMIQDHPLMGLGAGQMAVYFPSYLAKLDTNTIKKFDRQHVSVTYNEILQSAVDLGPLGALCMIVLLIVTPVLGLLRFGNFRPDDHDGELQWLFALMASGYATNSMVDYPLMRPEIIVLFGVALGVIWRGPSIAKSWILVQPRAKWPGTIVSAAAALFLMIATTCWATSLYNRSLAYGAPTITYTKTAIKFWPWERDVLNNHLFLSNGGIEAKDAVKNLVRYWPESPYIQTTAANFFINYNEFQTALEIFKHLFQSWPLSYRRAYERYQFLMSQPELPAHLLNLSPKILAKYQHLDKHSPYARQNPLAPPDDQILIPSTYLDFKGSNNRSFTASVFSQGSTKRAVLWWNLVDDNQSQPLNDRLPYYLFFKSLNYDIIQVDLPKTPQKTDVDAVFANLKKTNYNQLVSWTCGNTSLVQGFILQSKQKVAAMIEQSPNKPEASRREQANAAAIPYFLFQGDEDPAVRPDQLTYNYIHNGSGSIQNDRDFATLIVLLAQFLNLINPL